MEEHRGQTKGGLNNVPIQARESTPIKTIVLSRPDAYIATSVYAAAPRTDPEQLYGSRGPIPSSPRLSSEKSSRKPAENLARRPRKGPIQAPNPNKSTPTRPRAGPEDRLLPPHGVCGTILPHPLYHPLYFVVHAR